MASKEVKAAEARRHAENLKDIEDTTDQILNEPSPSDRSAAT